MMFALEEGRRGAGATDESEAGVGGGALCSLSEEEMLKLGAPNETARPPREAGVGCAFASIW